MSVTLDDVNSILDAVERGVKRAVVVDFFTSGGAKPPNHVRVVQQTVTVPTLPQTPPIIQSVQAHPKPQVAPEPAPANKLPVLSPEQEEQANIAKMLADHKQQAAKLATDSNRQRMDIMRKIAKQWTYDSIAKNISITTVHRGHQQEGCTRVGVAMRGQVLRGPITASTLRTWLHKGSCPKEHEHAIVTFLERYSGQGRFYLKLSPAGDRYID